MTLVLDALEQAISHVQRARHEVQWISADNPVWLTIWHAEQYLAQQFKEEFNDYFKTEEEDECT